MFVAKLNEALTSKKSFIKEPANFFGIGIAGLLNIIHWALLVSNIKPNSTSVLLHYNVVFGADFIGEGIYAYLIPLIALILLIINISLAMNFFKKEKLAAYFLSLANIPVQLVFLAATIVLVVING